MREFWKNIPMKKFVITYLFSPREKTINQSTISKELSKSSSFPTGQARILFVKLPYTLATEEAERIGLDHVARSDERAKVVLVF